jgi:hypothetical protein
MLNLIIDIYSTCTIEKRMRLSRLKRQREESPNPIRRENSDVSFDLRVIISEGNDEAKFKNEKTE